MSGFSLLILLAGSYIVVFGQFVDENISDDVNEDAFLSVPELIEKYDYPCEVHHLQTEDGYILELHRIPYGIAEGAGPEENKSVVLLQHGLICSSADWILAGPKKGLGYLLADLGYDVWMGNCRGNKYSRQHVDMSPSDGDFWDFSWHEIGVYDLPAIIDYVVETSGEERIFYIGHSQGTTSFYVLCSERPEYNSKIRAMISLAPVAYMKHITSPLLQFTSKFEGGITPLSKLIGFSEFLPNSELLALVGAAFCTETSLTQFLCTNPLFVICGYNFDQLNTELFPVIMGHDPAGAAVKQLLHYAQLINSGEFRQFDYGVQNLVKYNNPLPPKYELNNVTAPVALFYSHNDWLAAEVDVMRLYQELANPIGRYLTTDTFFSHMDFMWGRDVDTLVYNKVFNLMANY